MIRKALFLSLVLVYAGLFIQQEHLHQQKEPQLALPMPATALKTILGYLRQWGGEMHFVKTSIFLGALDPSKPWDLYADSLARNFKVMSELHPHFRDTYFLAESGLANIGPQQARETNAILETGMKARPDDWFLPFFRGFNHFYYLQENRKAADDLLAASRLPDGPPWLAHLASMLAAEGGDIQAGLIWMQAMLQTEEDEAMREKYSNDIAAFEKALKVQKAIYAYHNQKGVYPERLDDLVPLYLSILPDFNGKFFMSWEPPVFKLLRPEKAPH